MGGHGSFSEPRTGVNVTNGTDDLITSKLPALQAYQLTLAAPSPPPGSFDQVAAELGSVVFNGTAQCVIWHSGPEFTDVNLRLHPPSDVVSEPEPNGTPSWASRSATKQYRTAPLRGLMAARALFSRWHSSDPGGSRAHLQCAQFPRTDRSSDCRSDAVPQVAVVGRQSRPFHAGLRACARKEESHHLARRIGSVGIRKGSARVAAKPCMRSAVHEPVFDNNPLVVVLE